MESLIPPTHYSSQNLSVHYLTVGFVPMAYCLYIYPTGPTVLYLLHCTSMSGLKAQPYTEQVL